MGPGSLRQGSDDGAGVVGARLDERIPRGGLPAGRADQQGGGHQSRENQSEVKASNVVATAVQCCHASTWPGWNWKETLAYCQIRHGLQGCNEARLSINNGDAVTDFILAIGGRDGSGHAKGISSVEQSKGDEGNYVVSTVHMF